MMKLTKEQILEMIEDRKQGVTLKELSEKYGVTYNYASQLTAGTQIFGKCKYCGTKVQQYQTVCAMCAQKRPLVRELVVLGKLIRKKAGR